MDTTVIIPTVGTPDLRRCVLSVLNQTVPAEVLVVVDGPQHEAAVREQLPAAVPVVVLPWNVGGGEPKLLGHPMYGAFPMLCKTKYVCFLDEDNWFDPNHVETMEQAIERHGLDWTFSLRKVWFEGAFRCVDNCESLGNIRNTYDTANAHLVDTSCYMVKTEIARQLSPVWHHPHADRPVTKYLMQHFPKFRSTYQATLNYDFKANNVRNQSVRFFEFGNAVLGYDFVNLPTLYVAHESREATEALLNAPDRKLYGLARGKANLLDAFRFADNIPTGSTLLVTLRDRSTMNLGLLRRNDLRKILVLPEPPLPHNVLNWDIGFMYQFEAVYSCWKAMEKVVDRAHHFPVHALVQEPCEVAPLDFVNKKRVCALIPPAVEEKTFVVNNVRLRSGMLDQLRKAAAALQDVDAYVRKDDAETRAWVSQNTKWNLRDSEDADLGAYSACLIPVPVDAEGYLPGDYYRCLVSGVVPVLLNGTQLGALVDGKSIDLATFSRERIEVLSQALESAFAARLIG
jgi:glycosyltransferase involved in cell wall biosynthesis